LVVSQGNGLSASGELIVGQLHPLFQSSFEYTVDNTEITENTSTGGSITQADAMAVVSSSAVTGSSAKMESSRIAKYRAGLGGLTRFTALFTTGVAGTEQYIGLLDQEGSSAAFRNGFCVGYDGETFGVHRFQNDVKTTIALADCDDPLDGSGDSGMRIDTTKLNVFQIAFQYLGGGAIYFSIEDAATGRFIVFHTVLYANKFTVPSTYNPNFHFTLWVNNGATTSDIILKSASFAFFVEGKTKFVEVHRPHQSSGLRQKLAVTTEIALLTIRVKQLYASKQNFISIFIENIVASIESSGANNLGSIRLVKNAELGGTPSYSDVHTTNSVVEYDVSATTVNGAGTELYPVPLAGKNDKIDKDLTRFEFILKHGDTLTVAGSSANSATMNAAVLWSELF
jgi:hypothetical protein